MTGKRGGFSLIEILTIVAVVGLLIGVAFPRFAFVRRTYDVIGAADQFAADLRRARSEAQRRNTNVRFTVVSAAGEYRAAYGTPDTVLFSTRLPGQVQISPATSTIRFMAFGPAILPGGGTSPAAFQLSLSSTTREVTVTSFGEVRVR